MDPRLSAIVNILWFILHENVLVFKGASAEVTLWFFCVYIVCDKHLTYDIWRDLNLLASLRTGFDWSLKLAET
jgi:hypothetical protein